MYFEEKGETKRVKTHAVRLSCKSNTLPLGQPGSHVRMVLNVHRLIRDREKGGRGYRGEGGGGEIIYLSLHCHHQNDSYIKPE